METVGRDPRDRRELCAGCLSSLGGGAEPAAHPAAQLVRTVWILTNTFKAD